MVVWEAGTLQHVTCKGLCTGMIHLGTKQHPTSFHELRQSAKTCQDRKQPAKLQNKTRSLKSTTAAMKNPMLLTLRFVATPVIIIHRLPAPEFPFQTPPPKSCFLSQISHGPRKDLAAQEPACAVVFSRCSHGQLTQPRHSCSIIVRILVTPLKASLTV